MSRFQYSSFFSALILAAALTAWVIFLPIQFGGVTAYVIVDGISMEPTYYRGDLVLTRRQAAYQEGEIVTYFNRDVQKPVIHRIIARKGGNFLLQGDNNSWVDNYEPSTEEIIGAAWIHLPGLGTWLGYIQSPLGIAALSGIVIFILLGMYALNSSRYRVRRRKVFAGERSAEILVEYEEGSASMNSIGKQLEALVYTFALIFALSLILAGVAFSRPESLNAPVNTEYVHVGVFSYFGSSQPGIYDGSGPQTGDPIFLKNECEVTLRFDYFLATERLTDIQGNIALKAESHDTNGWVRTFPLAESASFNGKDAEVQGTLNPCQILATLRRAEQETGIRREIYTLVILPQVNITAVDNLLPVQSTFAPRLLFYLDEYQMFVLNEDAAADPLAPFKTETQPVIYDTPNQIQFPGFGMTVRVARVLSLLGLFASLGLGGFVGWSVYAETKRDPSLAILLRYGGLIVKVTQASFDLRAKEILLDSMEDLIKMAERNATAVLHMEREGWHDFLVEGNQVVYRYRLPRRSAP